MEAIVSVLQQIADALFSTAADSQGAVVIFWEWLTSTAVLPYFLIGVGVSMLLLAVRIVKGIFWGV